MTVKDLCKILSPATKLRIKERVSDRGIECLRYDLFDPLGFTEDPELDYLKDREVLQIWADATEHGRIVIKLRKESTEC